MHERFLRDIKVFFKRPTLQNAFQFFSMVQKCKLLVFDFNKAGQLSTACTIFHFFSRGAKLS